MSLCLADIKGDIEGDYDIIVDLPRNATNGEVIQALFPHIEIETYGLITNVKGLDCDKGALDPYRQFWSDWWNAPYKAESEGKE